MVSPPWVHWLEDEEVGRELHFLSTVSRGLVDIEYGCIVAVTRVNLEKDRPPELFVGAGRAKRDPISDHLAGGDHHAGDPSLS